MYRNERKDLIFVVIIVPTNCLTYGIFISVETLIYVLSTLNQFRHVCLSHIKHFHISSGYT